MCAATKKGEKVVVVEPVAPKKVAVVEPVAPKKVAVAVDPAPAKKVRDLSLGRSAFCALFLSVRLSREVSRWRYRTVRRAEA